LSIEYNSHFFERFIISNYDRVQELMEGADPGRVPRTIEVELTDDQVDTCVPGDVVTICGQVKVSGID
jgi:DNA replicative helicase MCM subunit Mcm2 (Cdc46/Mcm family)